MGTQTEVDTAADSVVRLPPNWIGYLAVLAALISAGIHLFLAPRIMGFNQTTGTLFYLNGVGFVGGILLYLSRYWRRWLYLVAAGYALVTIVAFAVMSGRVSSMSIAAKTAEVVLVATTLYLYRERGLETGPS